jgi:ubiquinone/menaquinone biosynthesis C-methylase UbiE
LNPKYSYQFKKPQGLFGHYIAHFLDKHNSIIYAEMEKHLPLMEGQKLLEIGFGTGLGIKLFNKKFNNLDFIGIDFSKLMYHKAKTRLRKEINSGKVKLINADFSEYKFADHQFDIVYFVNVIYFRENYSKELSNIYNILNTNGSLVFHMANCTALEKNALTNTNVFHKHEIKSVMDTMNEIGFKNIQEIQVISRNNHSFIKGSRN